MVKIHTVFSIIKSLDRSIRNLHLTVSYFEIDFNSSCTLKLSEIHLQNLLNIVQNGNRATVTVTVINDDLRLSFCFCFLLFQHYLAYLKTEFKDLISADGFNSLFRIGQCSWLHKPKT